MDAHTYFHTTKPRKSQALHEHSASSLLGFDSHRLDQDGVHGRSLFASFDLYISTSLAEGNHDGHDLALAGEVADTDARNQVCGLFASALEEVEKGFIELAKCLLQGNKPPNLSPKEGTRLLSLSMNGRVLRHA